ncbi:protein FAM32A-like [Octodon degus]|uniref:Protein FAM32A n=1 Tax=Octodon degus TaxID=10160 RepID=A0A6P3VEB1_OCTDE|nr:protein FAM32A-like [Octodon degus]
MWQLLHSLSAYKVITGSEGIIYDQELWISAVEAYEQVQKGPLKLKSVAELSMTKWKKDKVKLLEVVVPGKNEEEKWCCLNKWTLAQAAFERIQEKQQMEQILKKASKTHEQHVEDFNRHLGTLTEHCDIPKVSWTK